MYLELWIKNLSLIKKTINNISEKENLKNAVKKPDGYLKLHVEGA